MTWLQRLLPWLRTEDTTDEAHEHMAKLEHRDEEVSQLGQELREWRRRNHFSGMVDNAIHRTAREGP